VRFATLWKYGFVRASRDEPSQDRGADMVLGALKINVAYLTYLLTDAGEMYFQFLHRRFDFPLAALLAGGIGLFFWRCGAVTSRS
jgi:hypothetical protein